MRIHALTACVKYLDYFQYGMPRWKPYLASWTVVTDFADKQTAEFVLKNGLHLHRTKAFYDHDAWFNQGAALEEARQACVPWSKDDWFLLMDADIVPELQWYEKVMECKPEPGNIYGAIRYQCETRNDIDKDELEAATWTGPIGAFQLMHMGDARVQQTPLLDSSWKHCGGHDSALTERWPVELQHQLSVRTFHLGPARGPLGFWFGRGRRIPLKEGEDYRDERFRIHR
jgi:hypothetical protein